MADVFSKRKRSEVMAAIHSEGNKATELRLAAILRVYGITGWRRHRILPGRPDFVFNRERLVVFVDGCFWHGCRMHLRMPQTNREYWQRKIARNVVRDRASNLLLKKAGWRVLRLWEHSLKAPHTVAHRLISRLSAARNQCIHSEHL